MKNLANKGRYGDSLMRKVDGELSHVNPMEAKIIDSLGSIGEGVVKEIGSGTINPNTGLKEYIDWDWWFGENSWADSIVPGAYETLQGIGMPGPEETGEGPPIWRTQDEYRWTGGNWDVYREGMHTGADHTGPPQQQTIDGVTWYPKPQIGENGTVWSWEWSKTPVHLTGTHADVETSGEFGGAKQEYGYEDIYGLQEAVSGEGVTDDIVSQFMSDFGIKSSDISPDVLKAELENMPKMELDKVKKQSAEERKEADIYGIQKGLGAGRQQAAGAAGMSGVRAPSAGGFKGMEDIAEKAYQQTGEAQRGYKESIYGLEQDVETKFSNWLEGMLGGY